jgi:hypothetical protein
MYVSINPIAISIRMSVDRQEQQVGIYGKEEKRDEQRGSKISLHDHMRN